MKIKMDNMLYHYKSNVEIVKWATALYTTTDLGLMD